MSAALVNTLMKRIEEKEFILANSSKLQSILVGKSQCQGLVIVDIASVKSREKLTVILICLCLVVPFLHS